MGSLSNLYISQSYQSLIHIGTNNTASATLIGLQDGLGNNIGVAVNTNGDLFLSGSLTASLQQGYLYVGNASGKTTAFATSSLVATVDTGSLVTTASFNSYTQSTNIRLNNLESTSASVNVSINNLNSATQSLQSQLTTIGGQSGSWITESETGSFATTGSNSFVGNQIVTGSLILSSSNAIELTVIGNSNFTGSESISGALSLIGPFVMSDGGNASSLVTRSGSIVFVGSGFTSSSVSLQHISSSANFVNFFMKNSDTAADTIISGSGNVFLNPGAPTAGFKRFMTGGNIAVGGTGQGIPQISASMAWSPIIANNVFANSATPITFRGPVSSSQSLLNNNVFAGGVLNLGGNATNTFERAINGTTLTNNVISSNVTIVAHKTPFIGTGAMSITNNTIGGALSILADSSSVSLSNNTIQASFTVGNSYYNSAVTASNGNSLSISAGNGIFGSNITLYASGSNGSNDVGRQFISNLIAGSIISASVNLNGNLSNINSTTILGHGLSVTGSANLLQGTLAKDNTYGSVFVGRHNAQDGNRAKTAETIFAVGTGNASVNKTGFLIDSGSNTFVEGTLNVSGSLTVQSGSTFFANGNRQFNVGAFSSLISQSGSANVSQSMNFGTTDISNGVSIVSNSRITLANAGTYNIQFSAQIDRVAGSGTDTAYIWLKKNGSNVVGSAGAITISGGALAAKTISSWNYVVDSAAGDYYELVWQATDSNIQLIAATATGNIPSIPSIILTVTQVR